MGDPSFEHLMLCYLRINLGDKSWFSQIGNDTWGQNFFEQIDDSDFGAINVGLQDKNNSKQTDTNLRTV